MTQDGKGVQILNSQKERQMFPLPFNKPERGGLVRPSPLLLQEGDKIICSKKINTAHIPGSVKHSHDCACFLGLMLNDSILKSPHSCQQQSHLFSSPGICCNRRTYLAAVLPLGSIQCWPINYQYFTPNFTTTLPFSVFNHIFIQSTCTEYLLVLGDMLGFEDTEIHILQEGHLTNKCNF